MRIALAVVLVVAAVLGLPAVASAAKLRLGVAALSKPPANIPAGDRFSVTFRVTRRGSGLRRATLVSYLSPTRRRTKTAVRLAGTKSLAALRRKRALKGRARLRVPASAKPRRYRLVACVEKVKPRRARKAAGCRASKRKLTVRAAPSAPSAPAAPIAPAAVAAPPGGSSPAPGTPSPPAIPTPTPAPAGAEDPAQPLVSANPRTVSPALDTARAATGTVGSGGGTVSATGANGTVFTLTIPAGALAGETEITMTPLSSIGDLPFDGLVGAVDLKPEGLRFYEPATLTLVPAGTVPLDRQSPFVYGGTGQDFHSYPLTRDPAKLELQLMHFTGAGVADGTAAQRAAQQASAPANYEAQYEQLAAAAVDDLRNGRSSGAEFADDLAAIAGRYYERAVRPRLIAAEANDELASLAITTFLAWARELALLGVDDRFDAEFAAGTASVERILRNAYRQASARCTGGELGEVQRMLGIARSAQLLGIELSDDAVDRCARFSLDYELSISEVRTFGSYDDFWEHAYLDVAATGAPLRLGADWRIEGAVPLTVPYWHREYQGCYDEEPQDKAGGTYEVTTDGHARLDVRPGNPIEVRRADGSVKTRFPPPEILGLNLEPGGIVVRDACGTEVRDFYGDRLRTIFDGFWIGGTAFRFAPWTLLGEDPWATFESQRTIDVTRCCTVPFRLHGDLALTLRHTPVP